MKKQILFVAACMLTSSSIFAMEKVPETVMFGYDKENKEARVVYPNGEFGEVVFSVKRYNELTKNLSMLDKDKQDQAKKIIILKKSLENLGKEKDEQATKLNKNLVILQEEHDQCPKTLETKLDDLEKRKNNEKQTELEELKKQHNEALKTQKTQLESALEQVDNKEQADNKVDDEKEEEQQQ